jgi:medium-chain acyl-[acyl-carrier-protein] hydrolase
MSKIDNHTYSVHTYELEPRQQVSIQAICNFIVDAAGRNVHDLGLSIPQLLEKGRTWFFTRFLIRMYEYPGWKIKIRIQTWPSGTQRLLALRDWRLFRGQRLIGEATSGWLMIDKRNRRPVRLENDARWNEVVHLERAIDYYFAKLPPLDDRRPLVAEKEFSVRYADVDINRHANYLAYIHWILEGVPAEVRAEKTVAEMEVHYLAEANYGEDVNTCSQLDGCENADSGSSTDSRIVLRHSLVRSQDGLEVARARTIWN